MPDPARVLAHRAWLRRKSPFPHVVARNVFTPDFYAAVEQEMRAIHARGLSEEPAPDRLSRSMRGYDAYGIALTESSPEPLALFLTPAWRDLLSGLFSIGRTPYVFAGAHHHAPDGRDGFIHNDFNTVWFPRAVDGRMQLPDQAVCAYKTGAGKLPGSEKTEVLRGVAMIFYLLNDGWRPGEGGETGLYASAVDPIAQPAMRCPPENNSLLAFECTPYSFHTYLANGRLPRTSIIMWVHRPLQEGVDKYGAERIERWKD